MSEEKECKCFCKSEGFRKFLIVATGTFVGAFLALSLFSALNKPQMPCPCHFGHHMHMQHQFMPRGNFKKFDKKFPKGLREDASVKEIQKQEIND